jgi:hypothetical protein
MKNSHRRHWLFFAGILLLAPSCGYESFKFGAPYKAVVLAFTGTNQNGSAEFALTEKTFRTLTDFNNLDGTFAKIQRGGTLKIRNVNGSIVSADSFDGGESPSLRYTVKSGVASALDYSTLAMLSAYYQLDEIYSTLESVIGLTPDLLQANLVGGKHTVLFEPEIKMTGSGSEISAGIKLNAAFSPKDKKFLLFQRSPVEKVPLAANFQVLTHEFGHFMFDYSFFAGNPKDDDRWSDEWALNGINEGFSDFVSWAFTNSTDILRSSIDIAEIADQRDFAKSSFNFENLNAEEPKACTGDFYCVGTLFARSLFQSWNQLKSTVSKKDMAKGVIETLKKCKSVLDAMDTSIMPAQKDGVGLKYPQLYEYNGKVVGGFLRAFVNSAPAAWKTELCVAFKSNFGTSGFPAAARNGSCD